MSAGVADRLAAAERLLADAGVRASVTADGHDRSVAVVAAARDDWPTLLGAGAAGLAGAMRALGFRYVAIDLADEPEHHR